MNKRTKIGIALTLAILLVAVTASTVSARRVSPWVGRWQTMDIPGDGSTNTLSISFRGSASRYNLSWRETFFTLCGGRPGIGRGTGFEDLNGLHSTMEFSCTGVLTRTIDIDFTYNAATDTITSDADGMMQDWVRISPPPF